MSNMFLVVLGLVVKDLFILPRLCAFLCLLPCTLFGVPYVVTAWCLPALTSYFWLDLAITGTVYLGSMIGGLYFYFTLGSVDPGKDGDVCFSPSDKRKGTKVLLDEPLYSKIPPPCVANLYDVHDPSQMNNILRFICRRTEEIVRLNPWLVGRLKTLKDQEKYDPECRSAFMWVPDDIPAMFAPIEGTFECDDPVSQGFDPVLRVIRVNSRQEVLALDPSLDLKVKCAKISCNKKDEPIAKITLVYCDEGKSGRSAFALVLSIAHIVADGASLYNVLNMFDFQNGNVRPLTYKRLKNWEAFPSSLHAEANRKIFWLMLSSDCGPVQRFLNGVQAKIERRCQAWKEAVKTGKAPIEQEHRWLYYCFEVDNDWLSEEKNKFLSKELKTEAEKLNSPFVSSNDIFCSWLYKNIKPSLAAGFMLYNMRGRLDGVTEDLVGNYTSPLGLFPEEFDSPANIRTAVGSLGKLNFADQTEPVATSVPGPGRSVCFTTNWAAFYRPLKPFPYHKDPSAIATHLDSHPYGELCEDEEGQKPVPAPEATVWRRNDAGDLGVILWHDKEPLSREFAPGVGTSPFKAPYPYNVAGTSMLGLRKNEFKK